MVSKQENVVKWTWGVHLFVRSHTKIGLGSYLLLHPIWLIANQPFDEIFSECLLCSGPCALPLSLPETTNKNQTVTEKGQSHRSSKCRDPFVNLKGNTDTLVFGNWILKVNFSFLPFFVRNAMSFRGEIFIVQSFYSQFKFSALDLTLYKAKSE